MTSSDSSVKDALRGYIAGHLSAPQLVGVVATAYYGERGAQSRAQLKPLMEIIERAHPGVVELSGSTERPGFAVRLAERPFPKPYESDLRQGVQALLAGGFTEVAPAPRSPVPAPNLFTRIIRAIRNVFRS